ncbi:MAG TPA: alanine dehydrogenase [Anaerolineales bacterium]|nr:alanine dehydrogenase [Anaerolineales bacterium]
MFIGIPKEKRVNEYRVGLSPAGVEIFSQSGHTVFVEHDAGSAAGFSDQQYVNAGATIAYSAHEVYARSEVILKLARPMMDELEWINPGTILMGILQLAAAREDRIGQLIEKKITAIAYEEIRDQNGKFPVLRSLSQIGGKMTAQIAAKHMQTNMGGKGILLGGITGVPPAEVVILGAGSAGTHAALAFLGMGAHVTALDIDPCALEKLNDRLPAVTTIVATKRNISNATAFADVVVGAVMEPGRRTPIIVPREMLRKMKPRSLVVDLSIDLGGCFETSRPTTHDQPTYIEDGVIHYCVPNVSALVARTATHAFVNASVPYILDVVNHPIDDLIASNKQIEPAIVTHDGENRNLFQWSTGKKDLE